MKKQITLFSAVAILAMIVTSTGASAATVATYTSNGSVAFAPSNSGTDPVDPSNPDPNNPIDPTDPDGTTPSQPGTAGPLSLDFASTLDFGTQAITSTDQTYQASAQHFTDASGVAQDGPDFVQMTDNRGTFEGWTLSVKQDDQFKTNAGVELKGAAVSFGDGTHVSANGTSTDVNTTKNFTLDPSAAAVNVMSGDGAATGQTNASAGTHIYRFGDTTQLATDQVNADGSSRGTTTKVITLMVPGASEKMSQKYSTSFTWTLGNTPGTVQ